jgi:hypothetical protein
MPSRFSSYGPHGQFLLAKLVRCFFIRSFSFLVVLDYPL